MRSLLLLLIRGYQRFVSPMLPRCCRFEPTCSRYAYDAIQHHGVLAGLVLTVRRVVKCAPWHPGGYDPVPPPRPPTAAFQK